MSSRSSIRFLLCLLPAIVPATSVAQAVYDEWIIGTAGTHARPPDYPLADTFIRDLHLDSRGYIWVATRDAGLQRLDGKNILEYRNTRSDSTSISSDFIRVLIEDRAGDLWIGTGSSGVDRYISRTRTFERYHESSIARPLPDNDVYALLEDHDGTILVGTANGLTRIDPAAIDSSGTAPFAPLDSVHVSSLATDSTGSIWIGTHGQGLFRIIDDTLHAIPDIDPNIVTVTTTSDSLVWAGTWNGIYVLDATSNIRQHLYIDDNRRQSNSNLVTSILEDRTGNVWVGTAQNGVFQFDPQSAIWTPYFQSSELGRVVDGIEMPDGSLWFASYGDAIGILAPVPELSPFMDSNLDDVRAIVPTENDQYSVVTSSSLFTIEPGLTTFVGSTINPSSMAIDKESEIWIGALDGSLYRTCQQQEDPCPQQPMRVFKSDIVPVINTIKIDSLGTKWIGTSNGLLRIERDDNSLISFAEQKVIDDRLLHGREINSVYFDADSVLIGTDTGIVTLSQTGDVLANVEPVDVATRNRHIDAIHRTDSAYWFGTYNDGIVRLDLSDNTVSTFNKFNGLFKSRVQEFVGASENDLAVIARDGIHKWFNDDKTLRALTINPHIGGSTSGGFFIGQDTLLYYNSDGAKVIPITDFFPSEESPLLDISGITVNGVPVSWDPDILNSIPLSLEHTERNVTIKYTIPDNLSFGNPTYRYRLNTDDNWSPATSDDEATISLSPGSYEFTVIGSNGYGVWNRTGKSILIDVSPPFHRTISFQLFVTVILVSLLYLAHRIRLKRIRIVENLRLRIARTLHDDIGANLSSIALKSDLASKSLPSAPAALEDIGISARRTAEGLKDVVWLVNSDYDTLPKLVSRMEDLMYALAGPAMRCKFKQEGIAGVAIGMDVRHHLYLIYKEALHNAVKHSHASEVRSVISFSKPFLTMEIRDNGVGFTPDRDGAGFGTRTMRMRASEIGAEFSIESIPGTGTSICLRIRL